MNCGICSAYLAGTHLVRDMGIRMPYCTGCRIRKKSCAFLRKWCPRLMNEEVRFCYECAEFPCERLQTLDRRYRTRYRMSMVENLEFIRDHGVAEFLERERKRWACDRCGGMISCHNGLCFECQLRKLKDRKQKYRWEEG